MLFNLVSGIAMMCYIINTDSASSVVVKRGSIIDYIAFFIIFVLSGVAVVLLYEIFCLNLDKWLDKRTDEKECVKNAIEIIRIVSELSEEKQVKRITRGDTYFVRSVRVPIEKFIVNPSEKVKLIVSLKKL